MAHLAVPVPLVDEQTEIVRILDSLFAKEQQAKEAAEGKGYTCVRQLTKDELELPEKERKKKEKELACFVPLNTRATNDYKDRWALAYCFNMYSPRMIWHFFNNCGHPVDDDLFAIACLIQWVFRSRIREGEPIVLYLPSPRMRELFNRWLNCEI